MRTVTSTLAAAQTSSHRTPYFHCVFTALKGSATFDCSGTASRIMSIKDIDVPYLGNICEITLNNYDRGVPDLRGYYLELGWGDVTGTLTDDTGVSTDKWDKASPVQLTQPVNTVKVTTGGNFTIVLPTGGSGTATSGTGVVTGSPVALSAGSNTITATAGTITITTSNCYEYAAMPRKEVRYQTGKTTQNGITSLVYLVGTPDRMDEKPVMLGDAPYYYYLYDRNTTAYNILSAMFTAMGCTLNPLPQEPASGTNTADAGTNTTTLVDAALVGDTDNYYKDWYLYNSTRSKGAVITAYTASTKTITCETIAAQTSGDSYYIVKADEIMVSFKPYFAINADNDIGATYSYESFLSVIYRLIMMTKSYLRERSGKVFDVIFPRSNDPVDLTINSSSVPFFYEYEHRQNEVIPNAVYVPANKDADDVGWTSLVTGSAKDTDAISRNNDVEIEGIYAAPSITTEEDAGARAQAILTRIKAETMSQGVIIPQDCRIEKYDNIVINDTKGL